MRATVLFPETSLFCLTTIAINVTRTNAPVYTYECAVGSGLAAFQTVATKIIKGAS